MSGDHQTASTNKFKQFFSRVSGAVTRAAKAVGKWFIKMCTTKRRGVWFIPVFAVVMGMVVSLIVVTFSGANPFKVFADLFKGIGLLPRKSFIFAQMLRDFTGLLGLVAPMLFASLAVMVALKAGLFNIGVSGQMLVSGFVASMVGYLTIPPGVHQILVLIAGVAMGGLYAALVGFLKYKFNINEVVSTIMLNYIGLYLVNYFINTFFLLAVNRTSIPINDSASWVVRGITMGNTPITIPIGILIAVGAAILMWFVFSKTKLGFEIKAVGLNRKSAQYAGINVGKNIVLAMLLSGCLSGAAGVCYFLGYNTAISVNVMPSMGFDAIAVALLGASSPIGCIFAALFISAINYSAGYMQIQNDLPDQIGGIMVAIILLFAACGEFIRISAEKKRAKMEDSGIVFIKPSAKADKTDKSDPPPDAPDDSGMKEAQPCR